MRISINVTNYSWPDGRAGLVDLAAAADESGLDTLWVADHLLQVDPTVPAEHTEMLEAYTTLGFLAAATSRVRLGTMVTGVTFREPALLIKAVSTVDVLSGGRAWLGIGAGHHQAEADAMGLPFPPTRERFDRLAETLRIAKQCWAGDRTAFTGEHYRLNAPLDSPGPVREPRPPILIGGAGEKRTLPMVARYADACNLFDIPDGGRTVRHKLAVLTELCTTIGRDAGEIDKTMSGRMLPEESATELVERAGAAAELGIDHLVLITPGPWRTAQLDTLTDVVRQVRDLPAAPRLG